MASGDDRPNYRRFRDLCKTYNTHHKKEFKTMILKYPGIIYRVFDDGRSVFEIACFESHKSLLLKLLKLGIDFNQIPNYKYIMLEVILRNRLDIFEILINLKPDLKNLFLGDSIICRILMARINYNSMIMKLIHSGFDVNAHDDDHHSPLYYAISTKSYHIVEALIKHGANIYEKIKCCSTCTHKTSFFHKSCFSNDLTLFNIFVESRIDVNFIASDGITPLMSAICSDNDLHQKTIIRKLLSLGADPTLTTYVGQSSYHLASQKEELKDIALEMLSISWGVDNPHSSKRQRTQ